METRRQQHDYYYLELRYCPRNVVVPSRTVRHHPPVSCDLHDGDTGGYYGFARGDQILCCPTSFGPMGRMRGRGVRICGSSGEFVGRVCSSPGTYAYGARNRYMK